VAVAGLDERSLVVVVRGTRQRSRVWIRLIASEGFPPGSDRESVAASVEDACNILRSWLLPLERDLA
jgi:hypothetical protein